MPKVKKHADASEHIFPASQLTPLAVKWKELSAARRHKDAMLVLEQIVEGSTAMFERLAQFENFHYTVELPVLVGAAQEKVVKWLIKWQPKKGRLFSWFSCHALTPILLEDGFVRTIAELVKENYKGKVICWNQQEGKFEKRHVIGWSREPCKRKEWRKLSIRGIRGYPHPVYLTHGHLVLTQTGWAPVDWLNPRDTLYVNRFRLTLDGQSALLGLYLGDGSILKKDFRITHGPKQRFYNDWFRAKFRAAIYASKEGTFYWNSFTEKIMDHSGTSNITIPLIADMWCDFKQLVHPKKITQWILDRLTPLSLAVWYMDDGSYDTQFGQTDLATHGFSTAECLLIQKALKERFGIDTTMPKHGGHYILKNSRAKFFKLIAPYVLREFDYKLEPQYRVIPKIDPIFVEDSLEPVHHKSVASPGDFTWEVLKVFKLGQQGKKFRSSELFRWKYDLTVEDHANFFAGNCKLLIHNSKCAKNAFRSELVKVNQYRKRFHVTSDHLEKFYGVEDHEVNKHDLAKDVRTQIEQLSCRWGDPQEIGAIRFLIECVVDDEEHDKHAAIRSAAYAYGISMELSKFFYVWALSALRHAMYDRIHIPFTEQDLFLASESYEHIVDLLDIVTWDQLKKIIAVHGGKRLKIPTLTYMAKLKDNYSLFRAVDKSDQDPDAVAEVAKKFKKTPRSAQEIYNEMVDTIHPRRYGEHQIYGDDNPDA